MWWNFSSGTSVHFTTRRSETVTSSTLGGTSVSLWNGRRGQDKLTVGLNTMIMVRELLLKRFHRTKSYVLLVEEARLAMDDYLGICSSVIKSTVLNWNWIQTNKLFFMINRQSNCNIGTATSKLCLTIGTYSSHATYRRNEQKKCGSGERTEEMDLRCAWKVGLVGSVMTLCITLSQSQYKARLL